MTLQEIATILGIISTVGGFIYFIVSKILKTVEKRLEVIKAKTEAETLLAVKINQSLATNEELKGLMETFKTKAQATDNNVTNLKFRQDEQEKDIQKNTNDIKDLRGYVEKGFKDVFDRCDKIHKVV